MPRKALIFGILSIFGVILLITLLNLSDNDLTLWRKRVEDIRKQTNIFLKEDVNSPMPDSLKTTFTGLNYFEIREDFRLAARFERYQQLPQVDSASNPNKLIPAGKIMFDYGNKTYSLHSFWRVHNKEDELFIAFRDATNETETYGGGRYLNLHILPNGEIELDFNLAYNPYCAYNPRYICPVPPKENTLPFRVEAGEKNFDTH